jgi:hypothetical protein
MSNGGGTRPEGQSDRINRPRRNHSLAPCNELGTWLPLVGKTFAPHRDNHVREGARELSVAVELRILDVSVDVLWERVRSRGMEHRSGSRAIERAELDRWASVFQPPDERIGAV